MGMTMKRRLLLAAALLAMGLAGVPRGTLANDGDDASQKGAGYPIGHFRHAVFFAFKEGTPEAKIAEIEKAFGALKNEIPSIIDYEWGVSESVEKLNEGFTHCFLVTFEDKAGLEAYIPNTAHQAFVKMLKPHLQKAFVFDYTARE